MSIHVSTGIQQQLKQRLRIIDTTLCTTQHNRVKKPDFFKKAQPNYKAKASRNLLESVKAMKLSYLGHIMEKKSESLEKQITQGTTSGSRTRGRPKTTWMDIGQHSSMDWIHIGQDTHVF